MGTLPKTLPRGCQGGVRSPAFAHPRQPVGVPSEGPVVYRPYRQWYTFLFSHRSVAHPKRSTRMVFPHTSVKAQGGVRSPAFASHLNHSRETNLIHCTSARPGALFFLEPS